MFENISFLGGNQRDLAREKNQKKQAQQKKSQSAAEKAGNSGISTEKRQDRFGIKWML